ncbi:BamA/TamA family outer membrane protein [Mucilaginibacter sp. HMF5004]|uniref:translocation and assembly module lipoprotein TamL n=1 Tax=Mucilaginibacter rivuli TaxID=2857527 RepID=UPI001C5D169B|nr:BamA/TamA family outer membrane protein [Mucilaginibacter rivuli]MBW4889357.1 BamA/TamA family outer membrane protein [Mucilaginibacter rivuli]
MKAYTRFDIYRLTILSIIIIITATGCSLTRGLKEHQVLVRKITFKGIDKQYSLAAANYIDKQQQPNNWLQLQVYYLLNKNGKHEIGEAPRILDSNLVDFSRLQLEHFLVNKGYLNAKVESAIKIKNKKAELIFTANEGTLYHIATFKDSITDPVVKQLYQKSKKSFSHITVGSPYDTDSLAYDRDQVYQLMKRNGYYEFYRQYVYFEFDTTKNAANVKMFITNPDGKKQHPVFTINNTLITIFNSNGRTVGKADTLRVDSQHTFVDYSHKFKPKPVTDYIFLKKGDPYNIDKQTLTTSRLSELNVFRNVPNPNYTKTADSTNRLNSKIDIIPLKHYSDRIEGEYIFSGFNNPQQGFNIANTFTNRNLFKGAEILQLKLSWSVLFSSNGSIQNQDFKAGLNLIYPRIISPFNLPVPTKYGVPHTTISSNYQLFFQEGLVSRKSLINSITYDWAEAPNRLHSLTPIDVEFSKGIIDPAALAQLQAQNRYSYILLINRTIFTSGSQYSYQLNANKLFTPATFTYFRGAVDIGGNTLGLVSKLFNTPKDSLGSHSIFGQTFAQYAKTEIDLRFYRAFGGERALVFRINPGIGVPYSNSNQLIFEKNFYVGGANDIRAWLPRTLGPGQFNRATAYADNDTRTRFKYLDQFGELKIVGNLEYRYGILNDFFGSKLNGAIYTDFGNVWRLKPETDSPNGTFNFNKIFDSTAIGIGTGFRFDLTFFVFRLDAAFKFKDPQFNGSEQWVLVKHIDELLRGGAFKQNYYKANGENYNFMQLNFGIGLPF